MQAAQLKGNEFLNSGFSERINLINNELNSSRPFTHPSMQLGNEAREMLDTYKQ